MSFLFTPKYEDQNSEGTMYFPVYRKGFGLLLGGGRKKKEIQVK